MEVNEWPVVAVDLSSQIRSSYVNVEYVDVQDSFYTKSSTTQPAFEPRSPLKRSRPQGELDEESLQLLRAAKRVSVAQSQIVDTKDKNEIAASKRSAHVDQLHQHARAQRVVTSFNKDWVCNDEAEDVRVMTWQPCDNLPCDIIMPAHSRFYMVRLVSLSVRKPWMLTCVIVTGAV